MFRRKMSAGLDVGQDWVKYAIVNQEKGTVRDIWRGRLFPGRTTRDHLPSGEEFQKALSGLMKTCQRECRVFLPEVNTSIQGESTFCRYIELPPLQQKELDVAVPAEATRHIPFPLDKLSLSFITVPIANPAKTNRSAVFFVAARKDSVNFLREILQSCGLEVTNMETPAFALIREFARNHISSPLRFKAIVHIGFRLTQVIVTRNEFPYYYREFPLAGRDFTYPFQAVARLSWDEAEKLKSTYDSSRHDLNLEPFLMRWIRETKRSLQHFRDQFSDFEAKVDEIYLSGGGAALKNIDAVLAEHIDIPVQVDAWHMLVPEGDNPEAKNPVAYKVAVGLALKE